MLDLLTIHPFVDGNGRIARALTNPLLRNAGYDVIRYVSLETEIIRTSGFDSLRSLNHRRNPLR